MSLYNRHPVLTDIRNRYFPYSSAMYPYEFMDHYYNLPVHTPAGGRTRVCATSYISGYTGARQKERGAWRRAVRKHFDAVGWNPHLKNWFDKELGRQGSVFFGHGLPEEISLVCSLALASGYKTGATLDAWAEKWIGIDCNGFVNAYLTALGTFSKPLHNHPSYIDAAKPAKTTAEISCDSVIVTARGTTAKDQERNRYKNAEYRVKQNPGDSGAHILVIDGWKERGKSFWATDQAGKAHVGPECNTWHIMDEPDKGSHNRFSYVWRIRKHSRANSQGEKLVFITREMPAR